MFKLKVFCPFAQRSTRRTVGRYLQLIDAVVGAIAFSLSGYFFIALLSTSFYDTVLFTAQRSLRYITTGFYA